MTLMASKYGAPMHCNILFVFKVGHTVHKRSKPTVGRTHHWRCYVDSWSSRYPLSEYVKKVTFNLHNTFENPRQVIRQTPFAIEEDGFGNFELNIEVTFFDRVTSFDYFLTLSENGALHTYRTVRMDPAAKDMPRMLQSGGIVIPATNSPQDINRVVHTIQTSTRLDALHPYSFFPHLEQLPASPSGCPGDDPNPSSRRTVGDSNSSLKANQVSSNMSGSCFTSKAYPCDVPLDSSIIASTSASVPTGTNTTRSTSFSELSLSVDPIQASDRTLSQKGPLPQKHKKKLQLLHEAQLLLEDAQKQQSSWASTRLPPAPEAAVLSGSAAFEQDSQGSTFMNPESVARSIQHHSGKNYNLMPPLSPDIPSFLYRPSQKDMDLEAGPVSQSPVVARGTTTMTTSEDELSSPSQTAVTKVAFPNRAYQANSPSYSQSPHNSPEPYLHAPSRSPSTVGSGGGRLLLKLSKSALRIGSNQAVSGSLSEVDASVDAVGDCPGGRTTKELTAGQSDTDRRRERRRQRREEKRARKQERRDRLKQRQLESPPPGQICCSTQDNNNSQTMFSSSPPPADNSRSESTSVGASGIKDGHVTTHSPPEEGFAQLPTDRRMHDQTASTSGKHRKRHIRAHASSLDDHSLGIESSADKTSPPPPPPPLPAHWASAHQSTWGYIHHSNNSNDDDDDDGGGAVNPVTTLSSDVPAASPYYTGGTVRSMQDQYDPAKTEEEYYYETTHRNHPMSLLLSDDFDESLSRRSLFSQTCRDSKVNELSPPASEDLFGDENEDLTDAKSFRCERSLSADSGGEIASAHLSPDHLPASDSVNNDELACLKNESMRECQHYYPGEADNSAAQPYHQVGRFETVELGQSPVSHALVQDPLSHRSFSKPCSRSGSASKNISGDGGRERRKKSRKKQQPEGNSETSGQENFGNLPVSPTNMKVCSSSSGSGSSHRHSDDQISTGAHRSHRQRSHLQKKDVSSPPASTRPQANLLNPVAPSPESLGWSADPQRGRGRRNRQAKQATDGHSDAVGLASSPLVTCRRDRRDQGKVVNVEKRRKVLSRHGHTQSAEEEDSDARHSIQKSPHIGQLSSGPVAVAHRGPVSPRSPSDDDYYCKWKLPDIELSPLSSPDAKTLPQRSPSTSATILTPADSPAPPRYSISPPVKVPTQLTVATGPQPTCSSKARSVARRGKTARASGLPDSSAGSSVYSNESAATSTANTHRSNSTLNLSGDVAGQSDEDERLEDLFDRLLAITQPQLATRMGQILLQYSTPTNETANSRNPNEGARAARGSNRRRKKTGVEVLYGEPPLVVAFNLRRLPPACIDQLIDLVAEDEIMAATRAS